MFMRIVGEGEKIGGKKKKKENVGIERGDLLSGGGGGSERGPCLC